MSDGRNQTHPRTAEMHTTWRLRDQQRRQAQHQARVIPANSEIKIAKVSAINANGDVQLDRFTDADGRGEWFSPLNGRTPEVGQAAMYTYVEGSPVVMGTPMSDEGTWAARPHSDLLLPSYVVNAGDQGGLPAFEDFRAVPQLEVDPNEYSVRFGAPPRFDPHYIWWYDHFLNIKNWDTTIVGTGLLEMRGENVAGRSHVARLRTSANSGNRSTMHITPNSGDRLFQRDDLFDMMFFIAREDTASDEITVGGAEDVAGNPWGFGVFFTINAGVITAVVRRTIGTDIFNSTFTTTAGNADVLLRIRSQLIPGAPDQAWRRFIFDVSKWGIGINRGGYYNQTNGDFFPTETKTVDTGETDSITDMNMGIHIRTAANSIKAVHIDYVSGWALRRYMGIGSEVFGF